MTALREIRRINDGSYASFGLVHRKLQARSGIVDQLVRHCSLLVEGAQAFFLFFVFFFYFRVDGGTEGDTVE